MALTDVPNRTVAHIYSLGPAGLAKERQWRKVTRPKSSPNAHSAINSSLVDATRRRDLLSTRSRLHDG